MKEILENTLYFLNQVEVKGKKNLDYLLAAMQNIENIVKALDDEHGKMVENNDSDDEQGQDV